MRNWSIKAKLLFLAIMPALLVSGLLVPYFVSNQVAQFDRALRDRGMTIATQLAPASEYGVITGNALLLSSLTQATLEDEDVMGIAVTDEVGKPLHREGRFRLLPDDLDRWRTEAGQCGSGHGVLLFCAPIQRTRLPVSDFQMPDVEPGADILGWVYVQLSTDRVAAAQSDAVLRAAITTLGVLGIGGFLAYRNGRSISEPLIALTDSVNAVTRGKLDERVVPTTGSEIGSLQAGVDSMITSLRGAQERLRGEVEEATAQLRETMAVLEEKNLDLEDQRRRAQEANQAKSQFLATMSHEIRTPISGIVGILELLKDTELTERQAEYLANLQLAAGALRTLIDDILDLSRIEAGKLQLVSQPFAPRRALEEVAVMLAPSANAKGLELVCDVSPEFPERVIGDSLRFRQVLINLVGNAIKFTKSGEVCIRAVVVGEGDEAVTVRVEVEDSGIGIPAEKQHLIFESFTQADGSTAREHGGSGLGTTIAKELVIRMGGRIGLHSEVGVGSVFWLELPWQRAQGAGDPVAPLEPADVVLLDGNAHSRAVLEAYLQALGMRLHVAHSKQEVLDAAGRLDRPLFVLAEGAAELRRTPLINELMEACPEPPLVCHLTFFNSKGHAISGPRIGQLSKPVTLSGLRACLRRLQRAAGTGAPDDEVQGEAPAASRAWRVLVAEDDNINAMVIRNFLEREGHRVERAADGAEAIEALQAQQFDVVFMDMRMPKLDGLAATRRWRALEAEGGDGQAVAIIALTANATTEDREMCLQAGMDDFLAKPVDAGQLRQVLARNLSG